MPQAGMRDLGFRAWKPMTFEEARKVLSEDPPRMETITDSARYVEAWMVRSGAGRERIKAVMERLLG
jgi:hypothetical protein